MLSMEEVCFAHHGRAPIVEGFTLHAKPGEVHLLEGPSGAGKSTLLRIAAGLIPRVQGGRFDGRIELAGDRVHRIPTALVPHRIGWHPQDPEHAFTARTVEQELVQLARRLELADPDQAARDALAELDAGHVLHREVDELSGGEATRVSLAAAGLGRPELLVLDEPTASLDADGAKKVSAWLDEHARRGATVLAAEHPPHPLAPMADEVHTVSCRSGKPDGPLQLPRASKGAPVARLTAATKRYEDGPRLGPFELDIAPGEVVCLTGANGAGKTTALHMLCGLVQPTEGQARLTGHDPAQLPARELAKRVGIAFQNPAWHITQDTVAQEVSFTAERLDASAGVEPGQQLERFGLSTYAQAHPWDLSGGERQRLAVATASAHEPPVLLLDEPTRGLDQASRDRLAGLLHRRTREAKATVVASHHPWMRTLAHRTVHLEAAT